MNMRIRNTDPSAMAMTDQTPEARLAAAFDKWDVEFAFTGRTKPRRSSRPTQPSPPTSRWRQRCEDCLPTGLSSDTTACAM